MTPPPAILDLAPAGLTDLSMLEALHAEPSLSQRQLAREVGLPLSKAHWVLARLIEKGMVKIKNVRDSKHRLGYGSFQIEVWRRTLRERHKNKLAQLGLVRAGDMLEEAETAEAVWAAIRPLGDLMSCAEIALEMRVDDKHFRWTAEGGDTGKDAFSIGFPMTRAGRELGKLHLGWANGRISIDDDDETNLDKLVAKLTDAVARLAEPRAAGAASADSSGNVVPLRR